MASIYKLKNSPNWYISFVGPDGKRRQESLGTPVKGIAKEKLNELRHKIDRGDLNLSVRAKKIPLRDFVAEYLSTFCQPNHAPATYQLESIILKNNFLPFCESQNVTALSGIDLTLMEKYKASRKKAGASPSYVAREIGVVKTAITKAVALGKLLKSPFKNLAGQNDLKAPKVPQTRVRIFSHDEYERLRDAALDARWAALITTAYFTGMRSGEIQHLRWEDVLFDQNRIVVCSHENFLTKDRKIRRIPMAEPCRRALENLPRSGEYVFGSKNGTTPFSNRSNFTRDFKKIKKRAGVDMSLVFYVFRHTFVSNLIMANVPLSTIAEFVGHSSIRMIERVYGHLIASHKDEAIKSLERLNAPKRPAGLIRVTA